MKQRQLVLPLLDLIDSAPGGKLHVSEAYSAVADRVGITEIERKAKVAGQRYSRFERDVRWARQRLVAQGHLSSPEHAMWEITAAGRKALRRAKPGVVITIYEGEDGIALWAGCEDAFAAVENQSVQAVITSPPYPLLRKKDYGNKNGDEYLDWITRLASDWRRVLSPDGSLVLNLGDVWEPGNPTMSLYAERLLLRLVDDLGFNLAQRFEWFNPSKMPAPAEWVTVRRVRVKPALERIYWLSPGTAPYADNKSVLAPYSESMQRLIKNGGEAGNVERPSGHALAPGAFGLDHGGAIPPNLISASNTSSGGAWMRQCRDMGLPIHPARFPDELPRFFIKMLTRPGDLVADPFGGSFTTAKVAREEGRRFFTCEQMLEYAAGGAVKLEANDWPGVKVALAS